MHCPNCDTKMDIRSHDSAVCPFCGYVESDPGVIGYALLSGPKKKKQQTTTGPDIIFNNFMSKWTGTEEELEEALEQFYQDIKQSVKLAESNNTSVKNILDTVDDYVQNHYFG